MKTIHRVMLITALLLLVLPGGYAEESASGSSNAPEAHAPAGSSGMSSIPAHRDKTTAEQPMAAIDAIIAAYEEHQVVAIGDVHGVEQVRDFIVSLVRTPAFYQTTKTIVIEIGNAIHQDIADAYVNGGDVSKETLSKVWRDMTSSAIGPTDKMSSEGLFDAVRELNATLPEGERLRIVLGDPPIDWSEIGTRDDFDAWMIQRDSHYYGAVVEQVYDKGVKGLLICGAAHLTRSGGASVLPAKSLIDMIEQDYPDSVYLVHVFDDAMPDERLSALAIPSMLPSNWKDSPQAGNTAFGDGNAAIGNGASGGSGDAAFGGAQSVNNAMIGGNSDEKFIGTPGGGANAGFGGNAASGVVPTVDGYLYLGPPSSFTAVRPDPSMFLDDDYFGELNRRHTIVRGQPLDRDALTR